MTQEQVEQAEKEVADALPDETEGTPPPEDSEEPVEELDYKALLETSEAERLKLENDAKARDGRMRPFTDAIQPLSDRLDAMERTNQAFIKSFASGQSDGLVQEIEQINTEAQRAAQSSTFQRQYNQMLQDLKDSVLDSDGKAIFDLEKDAAFQDVRTAWNKAYGVGDVGGLYAVQTTVQGRVIAEERKRQTAAMAEVKKQAKVSKQKAMNDAEVLDVETGKGGVSSEEPAWKKLSPKEKILHHLNASEEG